MQPGVKDLFFVLFVDSQQQVLETASEILKIFEREGVENIWFSDVCSFYFLMSGLLVMWMAAGFTMLESAGLVRSKNTVEILTCLY